MLHLSSYQVYPFGLTMAGISTKAAGGVENKHKFTSQLFDNEFDWNTYQMKWRTMDPQIGRFLQIDPLAPSYVHNSTYAYAENDVIRAIDIEGLEKYIKIRNSEFSKKGAWQSSYEKRTIVTQTDASGNLKDQHLRSPKGDLLNQKDAFTFDNINNENSGPATPTSVDKYIAKNGIIKIEDAPGTPTQFTDETQKTILGNTEPIGAGEKIITSEGYIFNQPYSVSEYGKAASPSALSTEVIKDFKTAVGTENLNFKIVYTINPQNKVLKDQLQDIQKNLKNVSITIIENKKQKINTGNIQIIGTKK